MDRRWRMLAGRDGSVTTRTRFTRIAPRLRRATGIDGITNAKQSVLTRWVPRKFHAITDELAKFGTIGLINLGVNFGVFNLLLFLTAMQGSEVKAKAVATVVATTCAYFLNRHWTYKDRPKSTLRREYTLFFFFNAVGLVIETGFVALAKYGFDQTSIIVLNLCSFIGIAVGTVFRFWAYRTHVFKADPLVDATAPITATIVPAMPATRVFVPVVLPVSNVTTSVPAVAAAPAAAGLPAGIAADDDLHEELVQLELADLVDGESDKATRR